MKSRSPQTWRIEISRTAEKQTAKLDRTAQKSILVFIHRLKGTEDPRHFGKALHGEKRGLWRYRVGDYRLICDIQGERITILVLELGHRKNVYR